MTSIATKEKALDVIRAALADAGDNPDSVFMQAGNIHFHSTLVDRRTVWRAYEISRQAIGHKPCCLACLDAYMATDRSVLGCEADHMFLDDCGADR